MMFKYWLQKDAYTLYSIRLRGLLCWNQKSVLHKGALRELEGQNWQGSRSPECTRRAQTIKQAEGTRSLLKPPR